MTLLQAPYPESIGFEQQQECRLCDKWKNLSASKTQEQIAPWFQSRKFDVQISALSDNAFRRITTSLQIIASFSAFLMWLHAA
eukprot:m.609893 g.609893  ORF g.609893 m.609893 type:complete len:83 (+) comp22492_c0_seq8:2441-2689(+)